MERKAAGNSNAVIQLPALQSALVILGHCALLLNVFFLLALIICLLRKREHNIARWLVWVNLLFLLFQFFYYKLY